MKAFDVFLVKTSINQNNLDEIDESKLQLINQLNETMLSNSLHEINLNKEGKGNYGFGILIRKNKFYGSIFDKTLEFCRIKIYGELGNFMAQFKFYFIFSVKITFQYAIKENMVFNQTVKIVQKLVQL